MHDPATRVAWEYVSASRRCVTENRCCTSVSGWNVSTYQALSTAQSRIFLNVIQYYLITPGLAYSFFPCADPQFYADVLAYADIQRAPELDFVTDGRRYGVFFHDLAPAPGDHLARPAGRTRDRLQRRVWLAAAPRCSAAHAACCSANRSLRRLCAMPCGTTPAWTNCRPMPCVRSRLVVAQAGDDASGSARGEGPARHAHRSRRPAAFLATPAEAVSGSLPYLYPTCCHPGTGSRTARSALQHLSPPP